MIHSENSLKVAISDKNDTIIPIPAPTCIICLSDTPGIITYSGDCDCRPQIHEDCLAQWLIENTNVCPICRKIYNESTKYIIPDNRPQRPTTMYICCCLCFFCVCIMPFAVIVFVAIYNK